MTAFLGNLIFLNPWLLAGLAVLPALWFLLRLMPPAPKHVFLPSAAFLMGLVPEQKTPSHTPWWILLLRLMIAALVILAFARPVLNPSDNLGGSGRIRILIENGWSAADSWDTQIKTARDLLAQADREGLEVMIDTSAPAAGNDKPATFGPVTAAEGESILGGLLPLPWPSDMDALADMLKDEENADTFFLSSGLENKDMNGLLDALRAQGRVKLYTPAKENLPIVLDHDSKNIHDTAVQMRMPESLPDGLPLTLQALGENGRVLAMQSITVNDEMRKRAVPLDIPDILRGDMRRITLAERQHAAATLLLGSHFARKTVALVSPPEGAVSLRISFAGDEEH